jgi:hypothetical protein
MPLLLVVCGSNIFLPRILLVACEYHVFASSNFVSRTFFLSFLLPTCSCSGWAVGSMPSLDTIRWSRLYRCNNVVDIHLHVSCFEICIINPFGGDSSTSRKRIFWKSSRSLLEERIFCMASPTHTKEGSVTSKRPGTLYFRVRVNCFLCLCCMSSFSGLACFCVHVIFCPVRIRLHVLVLVQARFLCAFFFFQRVLFYNTESVNHHDWTRQYRFAKEVTECFLQRLAFCQEILIYLRSHGWLNNYRGLPTSCIDLVSNL